MNFFLTAHTRMRAPIWFLREIHGKYEQNAYKFSELANTVNGDRRSESHQMSIISPETSLHFHDQRILIPTAPRLNSRRL